MKKKLITILSLLFVTSLAFALTACKKITEIDKLRQEGYKIFVTYEALNGEFASDPTISIKHAFKPSEYEADSSGNISISLKEPTSSELWSDATHKINVSFLNHSLLGWYKKAVIRKDSEGNVLDEYGRRLYVNDGVYYVDEKFKEVGYPAYDYSEPWDFGSDKITYNAAENDVLEMTLYAGWIRYYEFDYYYKYNDSPANAEWIRYGETYFDLLAHESSGDDKNTAILPDWSDGAMKHSAAYSDGTTFNFPRLDGATFMAAYSDENALPESKITDRIAHNGSYNKNDCTEENRVKNVYVVFERGERYVIDTAEQLSKNGNLAGIYTIRADLDFANVKWPSVLESGEFTGSFDGGGNAIKNVTVTHTNKESGYGGLFGKIAKGASVRNVTFKNISFKTPTGLQSDYLKLTNGVKSVYFGTFAGYIENGAELSAVAIEKANFTFGYVTMSGEAKKSANLNLVANDFREKPDAASLTYDANDLHFTVGSYQPTKQSAYYFSFALFNDKNELHIPKEEFISGTKIIAEIKSDRTTRYKNVEESYQII